VESIPLCRCTEGKGIMANRAIQEGLGMFWGASKLGKAKAIA
jgi:hypothetical protein